MAKNVVLIEQNEGYVVDNVEIIGDPKEVETVFLDWSELDARIHDNMTDMVNDWICEADKLPQGPARTRIFRTLREDYADHPYLVLGKRGCWCGVAKAEHSAEWD